MTELAGFDVIAELDMDTIIDLVNYQPVINQFDKKTIFILGGPFSTDLDLGSLVHGPLRAILEARLFAKVHQSSSGLVISMKGGTIEVAGGGLVHIEATFSVEVPMWFELAPDPNNNNLYVPTLFLSHEKPKCFVGSTNSN